jgi:2-oxoglutarate dehydrogenase E2 component (dihydrolipoamide succinyltransferase)
MATVPIQVPGVGESITEGILARWIKPDGSAVKTGEPLFELETDKTSQVIPAPADGTLKIGVAEGETVEIGAIVGQLDPEAAPSAQATPAPKASSAPATTSPATPLPQQVNGGGQPLSPAARRLAAESGVDTSRLAGSGRGGLVTKEDVARQSESPAAVAPSAAATAPAPPRPAPEPPAPTAADGRRETRQRMSGIRQKIAQRLVEAQQTAAILTTFNEADMSRVMELRARYKETFSKKHGINLGFMSFFVKAVVEALKAFPSVNGRIEGNEIVLNHYYDIGVAVSTERGLMVPIIRDADRLSFAGIEKSIGDYAKKARDNAINVADLQGGTFTITNGGVFGSMLSTPILNRPQSAILGMHSIQKRAVVVDDQVVVRPMMYLALSYDHRIIDGREAVSFLVRIKDCIENPERMMLDI